MGKCSERVLKNSARARARINADPVKKAAKQAYMRKYSQEYKKKFPEKIGKYQKDNPIKLRLQRKKLDLEHASVVEATKVCDICGGEPDGKWKSLNVDHCHETNTFRGMLCQKCNQALGLFRDDPVLLRKAARYLELHSIKIGKKVEYI